MAIRRPSWDLSAAEIDARAKAAKVDSYFKGPQQARADSTASSREADRQIITDLARNMTADQIVEFSAALRRGESPASAARMIRTDAVETGDGLEMTVRYDESNRPIREFRSLDGRKRWMAPYKAQPHQMIRLCTTPQTPAQNARFEASWRDTQSRLARGENIVFSLDD